jgi:hypothetical protein
MVTASAWQESSIAMLVVRLIQFQQASPDTQDAQVKPGQQHRKNLDARSLEVALELHIAHQVHP